MDEGLGERFFIFVIDVLKFCRTINYDVENKIIITQLTKSVTHKDYNIKLRM